MNFDPRNQCVRLRDILKKARKYDYKLDKLDRFRSF